ncbi:MAG: 3-deoxy-8-phosphooctulonate synthase [Chlorobium sp.]|nr:3-deoxy-8-phosphooctulonate synthase [Chlorobium sp.]MCW8815933.1 3-deoxy-8-phosphooctulonate synthase [Chlorobium sp.]
MEVNIGLDSCVEKSQQFSVGNLKVPLDKGLFFIAGPCVIEGREMALDVASVLHTIRESEGIAFIFKGSFRKANRSSVSSFTGIGDSAALEILGEIRERFDMPVLTDVHETQEVERVSPYVDVLQIPAFLSRQTDLLTAAGRSGLSVNIKKGQFMAPEDMALAAQKVAETGNTRIMLTERGTTFGYHNLVVDFRGIPEMSKTGYPVVYDATHSLQLPSSAQGTSGGVREYLLPMARAAVAAGVHGLFFEVHPEPQHAMSDAATQVSLKEFPEIVHQMQKLHACIENQFFSSRSNF